MGFKRFTNSVKDAVRGLRHVFKTEQNFRVQVFSGLITLAVTMYFPLRLWERIVVLLLIIMVLAMELLNTALEYFTDLLKPRLHHYVLNIKDIMAGAVLITSLGALVIGAIILLPYFILLFK